jgi:hypothetical protein
LNINRNTVNTCIKKYKKTNQITKRHKGGNKKKDTVSDGIKKYIIELQNKDSTMRLLDIQNTIHDNSPPLSPPPPSINTIWRILRAAGFRTHQLQNLPVARNTLVTKENRKKWVEEVGSKLIPNNCIFIDESPFSFCITRTRGRSIKNTPATTTVPQIKGKNHTLIAAISPTFGLLYYEIKLTEPDIIFKRKKSKKKIKTAPKGVNRDIFRSFLINLFQKLHSSSSSSSASSSSSSSIPFQFLYDNCRIHKGDIEDLVHQTGYDYIYLPAWSPVLNPIEYCFSKWKFVYRRLKPKTENEVDEAIKKSALDISPSDCMNWFNHCKSLYKNCIDMKDM